MQASQNCRHIVRLLDDLEDHFGPVSDDEEGSICMVEQRNIKDSTIFGDEVVKVDPLVLVDKLVHHKDFLVARSSNWDITD